MRRSAALLASAVGLATAAAGCRERDTEEATAAVRGFVAALERGDGRAACERLAEPGVADLFVTAIRAETSGDGLEAPDADRCALVAERLAANASAPLAELRSAPVTAVRLEGDRATVETRAGSYELEERDGRWLVSGLEPVTRVLADGTVPREPVHLTLVRPRNREPAPGPAVAVRADDDVAEISGTLVPGDATLEARPSGATRVTKLEHGDGRFRVELALQRGVNEVVLSATAPGRERIERLVRLTLK